MTKESIDEQILSILESAEQEINDLLGYDKNITNFVDASNLLQGPVECNYYEKRNQYIKQMDGYGIGNQMMLTTAAKSIYNFQKKPVLWWFSDDEIASLWYGSQYILPYIDSVVPDGVEQFNDRGLPKRLDGESDYEAWHRIAHAIGPLEVVPPTVEYSPTANKVAVMHGCDAGSKFLAAKDLTKIGRQKIIDSLKDSGKEIMILGNESDYTNFWADMDLSGIEHHFNLDLLSSVQKMFTCSDFIANDTGLYHVAASVMSGTVYWHETDMIKNRCPNSAVKHLKLEDLLND